MYINLMILGVEGGSMSIILLSRSHSSPIASADRRLLHNSRTYPYGKITVICHSGCDGLRSVCMENGGYA